MRGARRAAWWALCLSLQAGCNCGQSLGVLSYSRSSVGPVSSHLLRCRCSAFATVPILGDGGRTFPAFDFDLCAPAALNSSLGAQVTEEQYALGLQRLCAVEVPTFLRAMIGFAAGADEWLACDVVQFTCATNPFDAGAESPDGAYVAVAADARCDVPCAEPRCVVGLPSGTVVPGDAGHVNCFSLSVFDLATGRIDPRSCRCSGVSGCGLEVTGGICQPSPRPAAP